MAGFWEWLGNTELAFQIGATWLFPFVESLHVLFVVTLVGAILLADLRVLGRMALDEPLASYVRGYVHVAWFAFVPAVLTGLGLFISRPAGYADNIAFQIKIILLVLAGLNVWLYYRSEKQQALIAQKLSAGLSLIFWLSAIFAGRWVGHISG
ncbi:MAG: hypothetical protein P8L31_01585 [Pseudomonadales bacterium]|nr:hypothetical protein [Pseudomonadales bacterium]